VQHYYNQAGQYQVQHIAVNSIGCTDTIVKNINVWAIPDVTFEAIPREGCLPLDVQFTDVSTVADGMIVSWLWTFGDGFTSVSAGGAQHLYPYPGMFDIGLTVVSNHGCINSMSIPNMIQVFPTPMAGFYFTPQNPTISDGVVFTNTSYGASHSHWDFGDGNTSQNTSPVHYYFNPGLYDIIQIVYNDYGCADTTSQRVRINTDQLIYFPNAISTNGDGINDVFNVFGYGWQADNFEMRIYSRWGKELFFTKDINSGWDGTDMSTGGKVQVGVYVWKIKVTDFSNNLLEFVGVVTVIH
jgi:gliding motility-associated-like protein